MSNKYYSVRDWQIFFEDIGIRSDISNSYLIYIQKLYSKKLPVIFGLDHLSMLLGREKQYLASVIFSPQNHYRIFYIPKRKGGQREICAPYPSLLDCQRWINNNIFAKIKVHKASMAYIKKKNIKNNALPHLEQRCLLKMDLENFFPTIGIKRVIKIFRYLRYPRNVSFYLARLCCLNNRLTQGAATSPAISNIVMNKLDIRLYKLAKAWRLNYTRYADDLTFSGLTIPLKYIDIVKEIIRDEGFMENESKTKLIQKNGKKVVTGISVAGDKLKLPRGYKRKLRQEVHYILKYGAFSHISKLKIKHPFYIDSIYGKLSFWRSIEPENQFVEKSIHSISKLLNK